MEEARTKRGAVIGISPTRYRTDVRDAQTPQGRHYPSPNIGFTDCGTACMTSNGVGCASMTGHSQRRLKSTRMAGVGRLP